MDLMEQLEEAMVKERISLTELGRRTGKSVQNLSNILKGSPKVNTYEELAKALGYEVKLVKKGENAESGTEVRLRAIEQRLSVLEGQNS